MEALLTDTTLFAKALITWTPTTFYVAAAIIQTVVFLVGFRLLGVDPEHNTFVGALLAAAIANIVAFFLRDAGLFGILTTGAVHFGLLVAVSSGEVLKSVFVFAVSLAVYGLMGTFVLPRTPLHVDDIAGLPRVIMTGGMEAEPITEEEADKMAAPAGEKD
ncbi:MAG: hypothetical protein ACQEVA_18130 [Myxococcota bacterium]